ncbi:MAG: Omp28-related outer membrane protein [Bacteroidales bacterium]|nr:Omp28-related outer membrane protein [Candidatus Physcousia equi]
MKTKYISLLAALCCTMTLQAQERMFQRNKVLVEKHTGQGCSACPAAEVFLEKHLASTDNLDNVAILRHHTFGGSQFGCTASSELKTTWGITAWPKLLVDRYGFTQDRKDRTAHYFDATGLNTYNAVPQRMETLTPVSLSLEGSSYDPQTRKLRITISGEVTKQDLPFLRISAFLTQSGIKAYQNSNSGYDTNYIHDDVVSACLMQQANGDLLTPDADGKYRVTREYTVETTYNGNNPADASNLKVVAFVSSFIDDKQGYYSADFSTSEVHNAEVVSLASLPNQAACDMPSISYANGAFVCQSTTPNSTCTQEVKVLWKATEQNSAAIDLQAPAFVVTAIATASGFTPSAKVSRTFTLADILGSSTDGDELDINGDGRVTKDDVDALARKILKK